MAVDVVRNDQIFVICRLLTITAGTARATEPEWPRVVADLLNGRPSTDGGPPSDLRWTVRSHATR